MSDEASLQAKIAALQGRIQKHKQPPPTYRGGHHAHRGSPHWAPYAPRGRGGWHAHQPNHRNKVLVLGTGQQNGTTEGESAGSVPPAPAKPAFVTTQAAGKKQLMTQDVFTREQKQMQQFQPPTAPAPQTSTTPSVPKPAVPNKAVAQRKNELIIDGLRFELQAAGSKLIRIRDSATADKETPKKALVSGVEFLRTKHGNLIRTTKSNGTERYSGKIGLHSKDSDSPGDPRRRARAPQCENFTRHGTEPSYHLHTGYARKKTPRGPRRIEHAGKLPKSRLTNILGTCSFGPACRFTHDPMKVAICKDFLRTGSCKAGRNCDMSHEPTYHRMPACTHFLRGNCTNSACRYPHVNVSPAASVCRPFATLGFCSKGEDCDKRHVFECPDYANHGRCANREKGACPLPHVDRAGNLRKAAERQAKTGSGDESDVSSSDEEGEEDYDSDVAEDVIMADDSHELSQQQDFIAFS